MAAETFQLTAVIRSLNDTAEIADVLGIPEVSALGGSEREWRACLQSKAKSALEDHELCPALAPVTQHYSKGKHWMDHRTGVVVPAEPSADEFLALLISALPLPAEVERELQS